MPLYFSLWWCFREHEDNGHSALQVLCGGSGSEEEPLERGARQQALRDLKAVPLGHTSNMPISSLLSGESGGAPLLGGEVTSDDNPHLGFSHSMVSEHCPLGMPGFF